MKKKGRNNSGLRDSASPPEGKAGFWSERSLLIASGMLAAAATVLAPVHALMALLTIPFCFLASYFLFNRVSLVVFKKEFQPPSKFFPEWDKTRKGSDWALWLLSLLFMFGSWFAFVQINDFIRNENFYTW